MKLGIPAATFATLLAGKTVPSKSDTILYTELATKTGSDIDIKLLRRSYKQKFHRLKQKAKARIESKKRLLLAFHEVSHEAFLATTGKLCDPTAATDLGILDDSCLPNQFCIEDSASELGGVCAKVVVPKADDPDVEWRGVDESVQGFGDGMKTVSGSKLLKPSTMHDIWKAGHILERSRAGSEVHSSLVSGECNPGTNDGYVDVGIFNRCSYGYFCTKDSSSNLGGTCVNIGSTADMSLISRDFYEGGTHRHLLACDYLHGTSGEKCSGMMACVDLSPDFIANRIGCGSCNAYGACRAATSTMRALTAEEIPQLARRAATKMELARTCLATQPLDFSVAMTASPAHSLQFNQTQLL
eukprot:scaffold22110_cov85-Cyclotella_meneghiniana.AAC.1